MFFTDMYGKQLSSLLPYLQESYGIYNWLFPNSYTKCDGYIRDLENGKLHCQPGCSQEETLEVCVLLQVFHGIVYNIFLFSLINVTTKIHHQETQTPIIYQDHNYNDQNTMLVQLINCH